MQGIVHDFHYGIRPRTKFWRAGGISLPRGILWQHATYLRGGQPFRYVVAYRTRVHVPHLRERRIFRYGSSCSAK